MTTIGLATAALEAIAIALSFALTGSALAIAASLAAAAISAAKQRSERSEETLQALATRAVDALERLADLLERAPVADPSRASPNSDRTRLLAEIGQAIGAGEWTDADRLLDEFEANFPGDPTADTLRERREAVRRQEIVGNLAQIEAARQVNDPARVLELYRSVESSLAFDRRAELGRDLSRWFLQMIHRRLRVVPIQTDVVQLATEVAETFGGTAEGASLRASLPMLRRSIGLCPRCAQPYAGAAAACQQCLAGLPGAPSPARDRPDPPPSPDADDPDLEPDLAPKGDRDDGWMRYDEDDRNDPDSPA